MAVPNEVHQVDLLFLPHDRVRRQTFRYALTVVNVASRYKEAESLTSKTATQVADGLTRIYKRSPLRWLNSFRLTLGASSWAPSISCWRSTLSRLGAVGLISTGTKASYSACYTQSRAPGCTTSCAASDGGGLLPVNDTTVRQFTIRIPTMLEFEYSAFIYKIYSQTTHFT